MALSKSLFLLQQHHALAASSASLLSVNPQGKRQGRRFCCNASHLKIHRDEEGISRCRSFCCNAAKGFGYGAAKRQPLTVKKTTKPTGPEIVQAGDPVLHEPAAEVKQSEIGSQAVQTLIDKMIQAMREAPGVGLAAPQIGVPMQIIVLEDTEEYIDDISPEAAAATQRKSFELLVIINPKLTVKGKSTARFFEGCLSVTGYEALVERHLEVEVTGLDRHGRPLKVEASGWQARILQHECDHLAGTLYVDKFVPRTFRSLKNWNKPLASGCPQLGVVRS